MKDKNNPLVYPDSNFAIEPRHKVNIPPSSDLAGLISLISTMIDQTGKVTGGKYWEEEFVATRKNIISGYQDVDKRGEAWTDIEPLPMSDKIGKMIALRIFSNDNQELSKILEIETDKNVCAYLTDHPLICSDIGKTSDVEGRLRRARIVGMLKSLEDEYISTNRVPNDEGGWKEFYDKLFNFFDVKFGKDIFDNETKWLKVYALYYAVVWNFVSINAFEEPEHVDESEDKFRGLVSFVLDLDDDKRVELIRNMEILDNSTGIKFWDGSSIAPRFNQALDRMRTYRNLSNRGVLKTNDTLT